MAKIFPGMDIRQMYLHRGKPDRRNRIADRNTGVSIRRRINENPPYPLFGRFTDRINDLAFMIGLKERKRDTALFGNVFQFSIDFRQGGRTIYILLALTKQ